jgi:primosomal protein N' (replication factor Y) (superfamily II helicase)
LTSSNVAVVFSHTPRSFSYANKINAQVGDLVVAPLRDKVENGIVVEIFTDKPKTKVKSIKKIIRQQVLNYWQIKTAQFIESYFVAHLGKTLRLFVPDRVWQNNPLKNKAKIRTLKKIPQVQKKLTDAQISALTKIEKATKPILLHGVTGSGKTEVYLQVIKKIFQQNGQAILLVPEIALTPQLIGYFAATFSAEKIAVWHSNLSEGERLVAWEKIYAGKVQLVIGSRSALFAPTPNLQAIILDEEHEWAYKNDQNPRYHARTVAQKIAEFTKAKLILGSATPSMGTYFAVQSKRVELIELPERINQRPLPKVLIADLRHELLKKNFSIFSEILVEKITERLQQKEQIILLLNRRGFANVVICRDCGKVLKCQNCSLSLTFHKILQKCVCHGCGYSEVEPEFCEKCGSVRIKMLGSGTQKIEIELKKFFPQARVLRADRDTTRFRDSHQKIYHDFREKKADILIGTQIVAKGLDLPNVSLVGVLLADVGLHVPDFFAAEKTFSLLTQVAGRSGRGENPGEVIIQTYSPEHPAILASSQHNFKKFFAQEIKERQSFNWPPFTRLIKFIFVRVREKSARNVAKKFVVSLKELGEKNVAMSPALVFKLRNKFYFHVIWRGADPRELLGKIKIPAGCQVDVF